MPGIYRVLHSGHRSSEIGVILFYGADYPLTSAIAKHIDYLEAVVGVITYSAYAHARCEVVYIIDDTAVVDDGAAHQAQIPLRGPCTILALVGMPGQCSLGEEIRGMEAVALGRRVVDAGGHGAEVVAHA